MLRFPLSLLIFVCVLFVFCIEEFDPTKICIEYVLSFAPSSLFSTSPVVVVVVDALIAIRMILLQCILVSS